MTNPYVGEKPLQFVDAKVIGDNVPVETYLRQGQLRGHPDYVLTRSDVKQILHCPHGWLHGTDTEATESTEWGTLMDCLILEPNTFRDRFAVCPQTYKDAKTGEEKPWTFNANVCKAWRDEQGEREIIKHDLHQQGVNAARFFFGDDEIARFVKACRKQVMVMGFWVSKEGVRVPVKGLVDLVGISSEPETAGTLADLKTCASAHPAAWGREVFKWGYHLQAALYLDLYNAATGEQRFDFRHVLQENNPPWETGKRVLSAEFIELGRWKMAEGLALYAKCLSEGNWPRYDEGWSVTEPEPWMVDKSSEISC